MEVELEDMQERVQVEVDICRQPVPRPSDREKDHKLEWLQACSGSISFELKQIFTIYVYSCS